MKKFFQAAATALTGFALLGLSASSAVATPVEGSLDAHAVLVNALRNEGLTVEVNTKDCTGEFDGYYSSKRRLLVICQDHGVAGGPVVEWTQNDLDTLRHEAQHFIQDCMAGGDHDANLDNVYRDPFGLAVRQLSERKANWIIERYVAHGADEKMLMLELEAFSVANANAPLGQVGAIATYCSGY